MSLQADTEWLTLLEKKFRRTLGENSEIILKHWMGRIPRMKLAQSIANT
jgi:hypothetical protein